MSSSGGLDSQRCLLAQIQVRILAAGLGALWCFGPRPKKIVYRFELGPRSPQQTRYKKIALQHFDDEFFVIGRKRILFQLRYQPFYIGFIDRFGGMGGVQAGHRSKGMPLR